MSQISIFVKMSKANQINKIAEPAALYGTNTPDITDIALLDTSKLYTYAHYLKWQFHERIELIKGRIFKMSPAPSRKHQEISGQIYVQAFPFFKKKACQIYTAPFDVRFPNDKNDTNPYTVVQPDICVICDKSKLDDSGCNGAPDLIVEILSPATARKDQNNKFQLYEEHGVQEYWMVHPDKESVEIYRLNTKGKYVATGEYSRHETLTSSLFPDLSIDLNEVFELD